MKAITRQKTLFLAVATLGLALVAAVPAEAARAPVGKTYFVLSIGVATDESEAYEVGAGCLIFTRERICNPEGECSGSWNRLQDRLRNRRQWPIEFRFEVLDDETLHPIVIDGRGRVDSRGPGSSFGGVASGHDLETGVAINFAFAGRSVGLQRCRELVEDFSADD